MTIDWLELIATAIMAVLGEPPVGDVDESSPQDTQSRRKWTRQDVDDAVSRIGDSRAGEVLARLLSHADLHKALFRGGVGPEPSAGFYYWFQGNRRSLWSLYVTADRPSITLSFGSIWPSSTFAVMRRRGPRLAGLPGFLRLWLVGGMVGEIGRR